ncbi:LysM peptidoglycan-binding domain-containing protein [Shewanella sp. Isolate7]|uniref:LysM peptidoglycan-binding domain-containing protein n=1 Tax=Shewanella sp. Isolate7 TaxID=2908528 RepID=UPI001EFEE288|nr:LysM peptidoglycan-binding domain-containing protein [Shewanella sp. Isolate7]MCG9722542.1 LysM peptidoglycan-binding domain-containing protein [Shewanella sp. Isolate7]
MRLPIVLVAGGLSLLAGCQSFTQPEPATPTPATAPVVVEPQITAPVEPEPIQITDVWQRIRLGLSLPVPDQKLVNQYRNWYLKHPQHLARVSERAEPFMYLIVEEIEKRNLPIELALLPIVESAFDPFAYSHGAASGLWQFTAPMAKHFGLEMNWWYDGRRDVPAATVAALDMMEYLYQKTHNNWLYAIAAYNTGEGRVLNAVKRNQGKGLATDFWALDLPRETERYVPQLLALADVIANADDYGISLYPIPNQPQLKIVDVGSQIDLALAADMAGMKLNELHSLNPGFNQWATAPEGPHRLVVPLEHAELFETKLAASDKDQRLKWQRYKIKSGDSLGLIAKRFNTTPSALRAVNDIKNNRIIAGKHLLIPVSSKDPAKYLLSAEQRLQKRQSGGSGYKLTYKVKSGDSLWLIAKQHKVSVAKLAKWNGMAPKDPLSIGQKLVIWQKGNGKSVTRTVNYTVRSGDSLAKIASKFNVSVNQLVKWNSLSTKKYLQPGQKLTLYVDVTKSRV